MFKNIFKFIYKFLIIRVILIDKTNFHFYDKLKTFAEYELYTNKGPIKFIFKEDRRKRKRSFDRLLFIKNFIVEIEPHENIELKKIELNEKIVVVTKLIIINVNYEILANILLDLYMDTFLEYFKKQEDSN